MIDFREYIDEELKKQQKLLVQSQRALVHAPEGYLRSRPRKDGYAFYSCGISSNRDEVINITEEPELVKKLFHKKINQVTEKRALKNIAALECLKANYRSNDFYNVLSSLSRTYQDAAHTISSANTTKEGKPVQHYYDPKYHFHETICGLFVRSKSEVIIANALTAYGIPFEYERPFPYRDSKGNLLIPDFTFTLPDGRILIWEHLGMLKVEQYSIHTAQKLTTYQKHGFLIGRNLILTQDDEKGNCSSAFIDEVIRTQLLQYFR